MRSGVLRKRGRTIAISLGSVAAVAAATAIPSSVGAAAPSPEPKFSKHSVVTSGLNNPRQLSTLGNGDLLVAEAGRGGPDCKGENCVGKTGKVTRIHHGVPTTVMKRLLSGAGPDGTFATGSDGASKRPGGPYYSIITYAPPDLIPDGLPGWQAGKLLKQRRPGGKLHKVANLAAFERRRDPDGEGFDSNPYAVLAMKKQILVADAAGDYIARVRRGKISVWTVMPEYGKRVDAVPTSVSLGKDGKVYVGELHSEIPGAAKVHKFTRSGHLKRSWGGFTTVTGVARGADGSLYVSELFGGSCSFNDIPECFPGRVVKVAPNGDRSYRKVPFPAGITVSKGKVYVAAFSTSPASGFGGNPDWSGAVWELFPHQ